MSAVAEDRVYTRSWAAESVDVGRVASELSKVHTELTHVDD